MRSWPWCVRWLVTVTLHGPETDCKKKLRALGTFFNVARDPYRLRIRMFAVVDYWYDLTTGDTSALTQALRLVFRGRNPDFLFNPLHYNVCRLYVIVLNAVRCGNIPGVARLILPTYSNKTLMLSVKYNLCLANLYSQSFDNYYLTLEVKLLWVD